MTSGIATQTSSLPEPVIEIRRNRALFSGLAVAWGFFVLWVGYSEYSAPLNYQLVV